jgi:fumarate hydratase class I
MNIELAPTYRHTPLFPLGADRTTYRKLDCNGVRIGKALGREIVVVAADALRQLAGAPRSGA